MSETKRLSVRSCPVCRVAMLRTDSGWSCPQCGSAIVDIGKADTARIDPAKSEAKNAAMARG